ncbi:DNA repair protein rad16 [Friedmanniomyces endolithicus]|nr:DNA repair protein rad16 [Friedmanniomyces endolithicus]
MARPGPKKVAESTSPTDTSLSSLGSTPRADSADYETPGTTPATSIRGAATNKRKRSQLNKSVLQVEDSDEAMEDADLAMARRLQEQEYAHEEPQEEVVANKRQKFRSGKVRDSEQEMSELSELSESESVQLADSEGELSELESELLVDSEPLNKRAKKSAGLQHELEMKHRGKPVHKPAPGPSKGKVRAAHAIARKSIGQTLKTKVEDSESELDSEEEFQVTESEAISTGVSDNELDDQDVPPAAPAAAKTRRRAGGRGRNGRRFGNYTEEDAVNIAGELEEMMLTRKDRERKKLEKSHPGIKTMWEELGDIPSSSPCRLSSPSPYPGSSRFFSSKVWTG